MLSLHSSVCNFSSRKRQPQQHQQHKRYNFICVRPKDIVLCSHFSFGEPNGPRQSISPSNLVCWCTKLDTHYFWFVVAVVGFFSWARAPNQWQSNLYSKFYSFFLLFIYNRTFYSLHSVSGCFLNCYSSLHWLGLALQDVMLFALYIGVYKMRKPFFSLLAAACCLLLLSLLPLDRRQKYFCSSAHT